MHHTMHIEKLRCHSCCYQIVKDHAHEKMLVEQPSGLKPFQQIKLKPLQTTLNQRFVSSEQKTRSVCYVPEFTSSSGGKPIYGKFFEKPFYVATENGDDRARTGNLRRARAALSQLSYVPSWIGDFGLLIAD